MSSLIPVSRLTSSDLSRLGNNLPRRKHRSLSELWHTEAVRRSLEIFERDLIKMTRTCTTASLNVLASPRHRQWPQVKTVRL